MKAETLKQKMSVIISADWTGNQKLDEILILSKAYAEQEREKAFKEARKLRSIKNPFGHIIGETFLHDLYGDYKANNPLI